MELKQVILVRLDLNMGKGKVAAQACHAGIKAGLKTQLTNPVIFDMWKDNLEKVVVLAVPNEEALNIAVAQARERGIAWHIVIDAVQGSTEGEHGKLVYYEHQSTCCAIGPAEAKKVDEITGAYELLE